ncbi:hypothetical protein AWB78_01347 [Caballeronia calidae]|uniref:Baseplate protein J-like domain-containing protein n=1 Tax=Caballeronia calidae TaxID=1777139 RepID=A0A158A7I9_9BURK|nr:hypothetical protein [Caballeronia calidae]SAK53655.1 hypothetical protein AWB78_01347 [Caballeronia calidae]
MSTIPLVMTATGPVPTAPATLLQNLINGVAATNPGYTANLPGGLIEDISSTDVGALTTIDQARVDAVNSVTPYGANAFVLAQLGTQFGLPQGTPTNGNVLVVLSGPSGYVFAPGFTVGDGTNQYALQDGGVIESSGQTSQLYAVATNSNIFAIPANTVTQIVTTLPEEYVDLITVTNPQAGTSAAGSESVQSYRSRVLQGGIVTSTGTPAYLKTLLEKVVGVQARLISVNQVTGGWQIICGGGDPYAVANAILQAVPDIATLQGSQLAINGMTNANPVVITTNLASGYANASTFVVAGASPSAFNGTYTVASVSGDTITTTTNGSGFGSYVSGAKFSPNPRNVSVSLFQNPNTYSILYVNPPQQIVTLSVTWNTTLTDFTSGTTVNQLAAPALQAYLNSIYAGQPINELAMTAVFQGAVSTIIDASNITTLEFSVEINGNPVSPTVGTSIIPSDPESYFFCSNTGVTVAQG